MAGKVAMGGSDSRTKHLQCCGSKCTAQKRYPRCAATDDSSPTVLWPGKFASMCVNERAATSRLEVDGLEVAGISDLTERLES